MKSIPLFLLAGILAAATASAQVSGGAQAGADAQGNSSTSVGPSGAHNSTQGSASGSASGNAQAGSHHATLASGTTVNSQLTSSLDAKKNKPGDKVQARTTQDVKQDGRVVIPKGSRLEGHVTQVQARSKDQSQSTLGIAFDRAVLKNGEEVPLNVGIRALAESQSQAQSTLGGGDSGMMAAPAGGAGMSGGGGGHVGGGLVSGVSSNAGGVVNGVGGAAGTVGGTANGAGGVVGGTVNETAHATGAVGGLTASGLLASNSQGVFGLQGLSLGTAAASETTGTLILSSTRNVHLDSGTQILLAANGAAQ